MIQFDFVYRNLVFVVWWNLSSASMASDIFSILSFSWADLHVLKFHKSMCDWNCTFADLSVFHFFHSRHSHRFFNYRSHVSYTVFVEPCGHSLVFIWNDSGFFTHFFFVPGLSASLRFSFFNGIDSCFQGCDFFFNLPISNLILRIRFNLLV